jgi:hypothetical protein
MHVAAVADLVSRITTWAGEYIRAIKRWRRRGLPDFWEIKIKRITTQICILPF